LAALLELAVPEMARREHDGQSHYELAAFSQDAMGVYAAAV